MSERDRWGQPLPGDPGLIDDHLADCLRGDVPPVVEAGPLPVMLAVGVVLVAAGGIGLLWGLL